MKFFLNTIQLIILISLPFNVNAQHLSAYTDHMDRFYAFDRGENIKIDDLGPQSFQVGGTCILFVSSSGHLKMYNNGKISELERSGVSKYFATDFLAGYSIYERLKVIYEGRIILLSNRCKDYYIADSLVMFYDKNTEALKVFYKGEITDIESGIIGFPVIFWAGGDNIIAYISSRNKDFKIWYKGRLQTIERNVGNTRFIAGKDIVAYIDEIEQNFKAFYKGEIYMLDDFIPESYKVGDGFVAFVTQMGEFKVFSKGEIYLISSFNPQRYMAKDNVLVYIEDNYFKTWYEGKVIEVEPFVPKIYKINWNTMAYLDQSNRIWLYKDGEKKYLVNEFVNNFEIYRDLIQMSVKVNRNLVYYNNEFYEGLSNFK